MIRFPRRRTRIAALAAAPLALIALVLTGCGRAGDDASSTDPGRTVDDAAAEGTIELWAPGAEANGLPKLLDQFEQDNPEVDVKITQIPSGDFTAKMTAAISAGTVPDAVYINTEGQPGMLATGGFESVPDGLVDAKDFFDAAWGTSVVDGTAYGVPWYTYAQTFQYRKDLVESAGLEAPKTWKELRAFAKALKDDGVEYPLALTVSWDIYSAVELNVYAHQNGGGLLSDDGKTWTLNSPANVEALEFWASFIADGYASPDGPAFLDQVPFFSNGTNAAELNGPWFPSWLDDANGEGWSAEHVGMSVPAAGPAGETAARVGGGSLFVLDGAKNPDAAWKLIRYMVEPETQIEWYKIFGNLPTTIAAWDDPAIADAPHLDVIREAIEVGVNVPNASTWNEVGKMVAGAMEQVARGEASAQDALDAAQAQADAIGTGSRRS